MAPLASQLVEVVRGYAGSWGKLLPETTESLPLEQVAQILAAWELLVRLRVTPHAKADKNVRAPANHVGKMGDAQHRAGRIGELLVRSSGFSRRGPGLASQRAGRWRARPAKAGTPNREFANAPAGGCTFSDFGLRISFGFRVSDFGFKVNPTRSQSPAGRRRKALVTGWPTKSRRAYPAGS